MNTVQKFTLLFAHVFITYVVFLVIFWPLAFLGSSLVSQGKYISGGITVMIATFVVTYISSRIISKMFPFDKGVKRFIITAGIIGIICSVVRFFYLHNPVESLNMALLGFALLGYVPGSFFLRPRLLEDGTILPESKSKIISTISHRIHSIKTSPIIILGIAALILLVVVTLINLKYK